MAWLQGRLAEHTHMVEDNTVFPATFDATFQDGKPLSRKSDIVAAVIEVLQGATDYDSWTLTGPEVYRQSEISQRERENNPDPSMYVWSPVDATLDPFDAEYSRVNETRTVEVSIWVLGDASNSGFGDCETYQQDVIDILSQYGNDNETNIEFRDLKPASVTDSRQEHITRQTDHYIMSVQAEVENFRATGVN